MLYQQGTQRIEVIVKKESSVTASEKGAREIDVESVGGNAKTWRTSVFGSESPQRIRRVIKTNATHALAVTKQVADLGLEYVVSGLGEANGDQAYQQQVARKVEIVKDVTGFASSVAMGALYGAWGGPIGAVLGAGLGAVASGASILIKYKGREREYDYKVFKEQNAIEYQRSRANINITTGRLR